MKLPSICLFLLSFTSFSVPVYGVPAVLGDLILGFRATAAPGSDANLEVNLGKVSDLVAGTTTIHTRLVVQDLRDTYGDNWATRTDLSWGIIGTTGTSSAIAPARTIWASAPETTPGTASTPWERASSNGLQNASNAIVTMYGSGSLGSIGSYPATANSTFASKVNSTNAGSWSYQEDLVAGVSFRRFNPSIRMSGNSFPATGSALDGTGYSVLDLWEVQPGTSSDPATLIGGIGLNSAGKLVFSADISKFAPPAATVELGNPVITYTGSGSATITLAGAPPGTYVLERSTTMAALSWSNQSSPQTPVAGVLTFTDSNPPQPRSFYRIKKTS